MNPILHLAGCVLLAMFYNTPHTFWIEVQSNPCHLTWEYRPKDNRLIIRQDHAAVGALMPLTTEPQPLSFLWGARWMQIEDRSIPVRMEMDREG
jgi:hypothetical protein